MKVWQCFLELPIRLSRGKKVIESSSHAIAVLALPLLDRHRWQMRFLHNPATLASKQVNNMIVFMPNSYIVEN